LKVVGLFFVDHSVDDAAAVLAVVRWWLYSYRDNDAGLQLNAIHWVWTSARVGESKPCGRFCYALYAKNCNHLQMQFMLFYRTKWAI